MNISDFLAFKKGRRKISMVTCYDAPSANMVENSNVDAVLVGDSVAMAVHGHSHTTMATMAMMALHTQAVARCCHKLIVTDMPFLACHQDLTTTMGHVRTLIQSGAQAIKIEGHHATTIKAIVDAGVPVMGHLGLTPQSVHAFGGYKVQAQQAKAAEILFEEAMALQQLGVFALVLECIPHTVAQRVTQALTIPTIGIGAGYGTDGQILVWQDLLGMQPQFSPKFLKRYHDGYDRCIDALNTYAMEVSCGDFPTPDHCYQDA